MSDPFDPLKITRLTLTGPDRVLVGSITDYDVAAFDADGNPVKLPDELARHEYAAPNQLGTSTVHLSLGNASATLTVTVEPRVAVTAGDGVIETIIGPQDGGPWLVNGTLVHEIKVRHYRVTRWHRELAKEDAALVFMREHPGERGLSAAHFEDALIRRVVKSWGLPIAPSQDGWRRIEDPKLAKLIAEKTGITTAMMSLRDETREAKAAKNSSSGDAASRSPPETTKQNAL